MEAPSHMKLVRWHKGQNVFDIQPGVVIGIFIKNLLHKSKEIADVHHADLWGAREVFRKINGIQNLSGGKYYWLSSNSIETVRWNDIKPVSPEYRFIQ